MASLSEVCGFVQAPDFQAHVVTWTSVINKTFLVHGLKVVFFDRENTFVWVRPALLRSMSPASTSLPDVCCHLDTAG